MTTGLAQTQPLNEWWKKIMTQNLPEPSRRSFIVRLTKSILQVASELNKLAEAWQDSGAPASLSTTEDAPSHQAATEMAIAALLDLPPAYLVYLLTFDPPRTLEQLVPLPAYLGYHDWTAFLTADPTAVADQLATMGALVRADLRTHLQARDFTRIELQALLRSQQRPTSGTKEELTERLLQADESALWVALDDWQLWECAPWAWCAAKRELDALLTATPPEPEMQEAGGVPLHNAIKWILVAAASGVIGNRADELLMALVDTIRAQRAHAVTAPPAVPHSPLPTPVQESPLPAPPPEPPAGAIRPSRSTPTPQFAFDWVTIPAGTFLMGSDKAKDKDARDSETPQHQVYLPTYYIARVPVTNAQYKRFVDVTGYAAPTRWQRGQIPAGKDDHPVVNVSWRDAIAFCQWAGVRLPSEAEWEKAAAWDARHGTKRIYPWGDEFDANRCNSRESAIGDTTPVDKYPTGASVYGVLGMAGNVWEWTSSLYKGYPYQAGDGREDPAADGHRVVRGGSFDNYRFNVRCAYRSYGDPDSRVIGIGFRVVSPGS